MSVVFYLIFTLQLWVAAASNLVARNNTSTFVTVSGGHFQLAGRPFGFYGTNAYWLPMATDDDIDTTFRSIASAGYSVVRTWAFNDVASKPSSGAYFQILQNGQATINEGSDGLQRLDKVVSAAGKYGIKLLLSLTNNWNPEHPESSSSFSRRQSSALPRGYLSNDYGGMDLYVRNFHSGGTHDLFYTDRTIINAFKNYISKVVPRYASNPTILGWEVGNDLRCASTVAASSSCNTTTITKWVVEVSNYIKTIDTHHLVTAGDGGFYCLSCTKLYATSKHTQPSSTLPGPSFDGSYGVDTEDILASPCVDFGSFQLFPDQTSYFPQAQSDPAIKAISDGSKWVNVHSQSAVLLDKPEVLTAAAIVTQENWKSFIPFTGTAPPPPDAPCGGVQDFQQDYAFTSWTTSALGAGGVEGVLEYLWLQNGLSSQGTTFSRRALTTSPNDGAGHYNGPANNQNAMQFLASFPPIPSS